MGALPASLYSGNNLIQMTVDTVWIDESTEILGTTASFPYSVLSRVKVYDEKGYYYPRLAARNQWLGLDDQAENGMDIDEVWHPVHEYHSADPSYPPNSNVKANPGYFGVTEVRMYDYTLSIAVVMDYSRSIDRITDLEDATVDLIDEIAGRDPLAVVKFSDEVKYISDFSTDSAALAAAIRENNIQRVGTALHSAVDTAVQHIKYREGRRVVVVYTDGKNDYQPGNYLSLEEMIQRAREHDVELHVIGLGGGIDEPVLKQMARETGGKYYFGEKASSRGLEYIFLRIYGDLRGYYITRHMSTDPYHNGTWRDVELNLWDGWRDGQGIGKYQVPKRDSRVVVQKRVDSDSTFVYQGSTQPIATSSDTVSYTIRLVNEGVGAHPEVVVTDVLSDSLTLIPASVSADAGVVLGAISEHRLEWRVGRLDVGAGFTVTYQAVLNPLMPMDPVPLHNRVSLSSVQAVAEPEADVIVYGIGYPDLSVDCRVPTMIASPTQPVTIRAQIRNSGTAPVDRPFRVAFLHQGRILDYDTLNALDVAQPLTAEGIVAFDDWGTYPIDVIADADQLIFESNETNNSDQCDLTLDVTDLQVHVSDISYNDVEYGLQGQFPEALLTKVNVVDQNRYPVPKLADVENWLRPTQAARIGQSVGSLWPMLREYNTNNPAFPLQQNIQPQMRIREIVDDNFNLTLLIGRDWASESELQFVKDQLGAFVRRKLSTDRMGVMAFGNTAATLQASTILNPSILSALDEVQTGTGSRLYDALYEAVETAEPYSGRNGVLLVAGERDRGSSRSASEVISAAQASGVPVFVLLTQSNAESASLTAVAEETGGQFVSFNNADELREGLGLHERLLRHYYLLMHPSPDTLKNQTWRSLDAEVSVFSFRDMDTGLYRAPVGIHDLAIVRQHRTLQHRMQFGDTLWTAQPGDSVYVTVTVENAGDYTMQNTVVTDSLPGNFIPHASFQSDYSAQETSLTWQIASLIAGESRTFRYVCFVDTLPDLKDMLLSGKASLSASGDQNDENNVSKNTLLYEPLIGADIYVNKFAFADSMAVSGRDTLWYAHPESLVTYQIALVNRGEMPCLNITVQDVLPPNMTFVSSTLAPVQAGDTLVWQIERVNGGRSVAAWTYTCRMDSLMPPWDQVLINQVVMACADDQIPDNNTAGDSVVALGLIPPGPKVVVNPAIVAEFDETEVTVMAPFSVQSWDLEIILADGFRITDYADGFIAANVLQPNRPLRVQPVFTDTRKRTADHEETVQVVLTTTDLFDVVRRDTAAFIITQPDLHVRKTGRTDSMSVTAGDTVWHVKPQGIIEYVVRVANLGRIKAENVQFRDILPSQTTFLEFANALPYQISGDTLTWQVDAIAASSEEAIYTYTCRVDSLMPPWDVALVNALHAVCANDYDNGNNSVRDTVIATGVAPPGPVIEANPRVIESGDTIQVCVMSPFTVASYDIVTLYANESQRMDYGDAFISSHALTPGKGVCVTPDFTDTSQRTPNHEERLGFVLVTVDIWNVTRTDTAWCTLTTPDLFVKKSARTDSMVISDGDTLWYVRPDRNIEYTISVENRSQVPCTDIVFTDVIPTQLNFVSFAGNTAYSLNGDTLTWSLDALNGNGIAAHYVYTCRVDADMPPRVVDKRNGVTAMGHREFNPGDNAASALVRVAGYVPPDPLVLAAPAQIEPFDSVQVRVVSPIQIQPGWWDVRFEFADGSSILDFADAFISANGLSPDDTLLLRPEFIDTQMRSIEKEERVTVILETIDHWNTSFFDTTTFAIKAGDKFWLDENVYRLRRGTPLGFRFQVSSNRRARITIYDISGAFVKTVADMPYLAGWNRATWDGRDAQGNLMGSGLYVAVYDSGDFKKAHKFIVVR